MNYTKIREKMRGLGELFLDKCEKERGKKEWKGVILNGIRFYCGRDDEYRFDGELVTFKVNDVEISKLSFGDIEIEYGLNEANPDNRCVNVRDILKKIEDCLRTNTDFPESIEEDEPTYPSDHYNQDPIKK